MLVDIMKTLDGLKLRAKVANEALVSFKISGVPFKMDKEQLARARSMINEDVMKSGIFDRFIQEHGLASYVEIDDEYFKQWCVLSKVETN